MNERWKKLLAAVEKNKQVILDAANYIWRNPELGYKEWNTSRYLTDRFRRLGYEVKEAGNIPGFTADLDTGKDGPVVAVMAELDSLICATHPAADPETKAVHACGHNCQSSYLVGLATALKEPGVLDGMCGKIRFISVPAEETIDLEFRNGLISDGTIKYVAGKIEFLHRGMFDDVQMALLVHASVGGPHYVEIFDGCDGCLTKHFEFEGKASHAGTMPWNGINALYMAASGMNVCNALRETFKDMDYVRFHPIITQAGVAANAIPDVAKLDAYCRAANVHTMLEVNGKINRALAGTAASFGGNVHIIDRPGNLPLHNAPELSRLFADVTTGIFGENKVYNSGWRTGSCDTGDLSSIMPVCQPYVSGAVGTSHGNDFGMGDMDRTCVNPARILSVVLYELLSKDAQLAKSIIDNYEPVYKTKDEYFTAINAIAADYRAVTYNDDGSIVIRTR